jgi:SAM-dependent methyltransferase
MFSIQTFHITPDRYLLITRKIGLKFLAFPLILLRAYFRYSAWHNSIYLQHPYAQKIVYYLNHRMVRDAVLEIGCGTGDILRRLNYAVKTGLDCEKEALDALNFF